MKETLENFSKKFYKNIQGPNYVHWVCTWNMAIIEDKKLWKILRLALPFEVETNVKYYGNKNTYKKIYDWLNENTIGLWAHSQIIFVFEKEEDAVAFKLRWS